MASIAKMDCYDYFLLPGVVQIEVNGTNDPILVDILSEVDKRSSALAPHLSAELLDNAERIGNVGYIWQVVYPRDSDSTQGGENYRQGGIL